MANVGPVAGNQSLLSKVPYCHSLQFYSVLDLRLVQPSRGNMRHSVGFSLSVLLLTSVLVSPSWSSHSVGEPALEKDRRWNQCCAHEDCVPEKVKIIGAEQTGEISVKIEGHQITVDKDKFHHVPTQRTWVCYVNPNGRIANENIRCILLPEKRGMV